MSAEAVLVIQSVSLVFALMIVVGGIVAFIKGKGGAFILWWLLGIALYLFLAHRVATKSTGLDLPVPHGTINNLAILIQLLAAMLGAAAIGLALLNGRINGR